MSSERLTPFLERVLVLFQEHFSGIQVDPSIGEPDQQAVARMAELMGEDEEDVRQALLGLRFEGYLVESISEFEGIADLAVWTVHPQVC